MTQPNPRADTDGIDPAIWRIAAVAVLGVLLSQLDTTIVNVALSSLVTELHSSLRVIQWVTSGYLLALTLVLPLNVWVVDRIGARALYLWCFAGFTLCSALCGLAWSANSLIAFRVLQGASAGLLAPLAQMIMARAAGRHLARFIGYSAMPIVLAPILGPMIAGAILHYASWRWLFLVNLPVGALGLGLAFAFLPNDRGDTPRRELDWVGLAVLSPGLVLFLYASDHISDRIGLLTLIAAAILLAMFFVWARRRGPRALLDLRLFKGRTFSAAALTQFLSNGAMYAGQLLIPIFLIRACGRTPGEVGWMLTPLGVGMLCTYPLMGTFTRRFGIRRVSSVGAGVVLIGTLPFVYLAGHGLDLIVLMLSLFIRGAGQSAVGIPSIAAAYASVKRQDLPMATTTLNVAQRLGGPTLTTLCATFLAWRLSVSPNHDDLQGAFTAAFALLCALHALALTSALQLPRALPVHAVS